MVVDESRPPSGIVFRRLVTPDERARARDLLAGAGYRSPRLAGDEVWSGLWDLTAADGAALTAAAATRQMSVRILEVRVLVARPGPHRSALYGRLVHELADLCRANGVEGMVAGVAGGDNAGAELLRRAGFEVGPAGWLAREV